LVNGCWLMPRRRVRGGHMLPGASFQRPCPPSRGVNGRHPPCTDKAGQGPLDAHIAGRFPVERKRDGEAGKATRRTLDRWSCRPSFVPVRCTRRRRLRVRSGPANTHASGEPCEVNLQEPTTSPVLLPRPCSVWHRPWRLCRAGIGRRRSAVRTGPGVRSGGRGSRRPAMPPPRPMRPRGRAGGRRTSTGRRRRSLR